MASSASPTTFSLLSSTTNSSSSSSSSRTRSSLIQLSPATLRLRPASLRCVGFAAANPLLSLHVASRISSVSSASKGPRGVVSMAKKSVGDLTAADLKGKKVFVRVDLNVPLDDNQNITDDTKIRAAIPTIKYLIQNAAKVILSSLVICQMHLWE